MQLKAKNLNIELIESDEDYNYYKINDEDLIWLLFCTKDLLSQDAEVVASGYLDHVLENILENIQNIDKAIDMINND